MGTSLPLYRPLTRKDLEQIDQTARRILQEVGLRIYDSGTLDILKAAGAQVDYDKQNVCFESDWLDRVLKRAPSRFTLYSRDGRNDIRLGEGKVHFTNGGRVFRLLDVGRDRYRYTMIRHVARTAALVDSLENIRFYIIACEAHALKPETYHLNDFYQAFSHTTKHVMGGCTDLEGAGQLWELASFIAGGEDRFREKPFASIITNVISPLTFEDHALKILHFCCTHGIPVTCAPAPIAGATAPATLAGTLSQMHAESLAGVAIAQVFAPGAKVLYGAVPTAMDLRTMEFTMGSVEMGMMNAAAVRLAKLYRLPIYSSAGVTEAKRPDVQAGFEKTFSCLMVAMAGADVIHLAAGMLDSGSSISYEQYVIDNEILGMVHRVLSGIKVDEDTLGFDVIHKVGPGGNYVMEDHTVDHMMDEFFYPSLSVRCNFDVWEEKGRPDVYSHAEDQVQQILEEGKESLFDPAFAGAIAKEFPGIRHVDLTLLGNTGNITRLLACSVFKPAIQHIQLEKRYPNLRMTYLPSNLHMGPRKLRSHLARQVAFAKKRNERIIVLYGDCFPDINEFCAQHWIIKVLGPHCYEMLIGSEEFRRLVDEAAGTFFLEQDLVLNFDQHCVEPLELRDAEIRECMFAHYRRVIYIRQPSDPDLLRQAGELAEFLNLPLDITEADYSHLERRVLQLM